MGIYEVEWVIIIQINSNNKHNKAAVDKFGKTNIILDILINMLLNVLNFFKLLFFILFKVISLLNFIYLFFKIMSPSLVRWNLTSLGSLNGNVHTL